MPFATQVLPAPAPAGAPTVQFTSWSNAIANDLNVAAGRGWEVRQIVNFGHVVLVVFFHN